MRLLPWAGSRMGVGTASVLCAALVAAGTGALITSWSNAAPVAQIVSPQPGAKLRKGQTVPVTIRVSGSGDISWRVSLDGAGATTDLASGNRTVDDTAVAQIDTTSLTAGESYLVTLAVTSGGTSTSATSTFSIADPRFTLIPLEQGNLSERGYSTYGVDGQGRQVLYSPIGGDPAPLTIINRDTGARETLPVELSSTEGVKFSGDGRRLFFKGRFSHPGPLGVGYLDLHSRSGTLISDLASFFFSVSETGEGVAYQKSVPRVDPNTENRQYFLFDETTHEHRQLTNDPAAIRATRNCPTQFGATPLISADGSTVVFITPATLGIVAADPAVGCRVFAYDVATDSLRQVAALPSTWRSAGFPSLSGDGRWLSFPVIQPKPAGGSRGVPVVVDVQTGNVSAPAVDVGDFTTFDSAVTRDGTGIIISTQADLDPRVGNADHNLELFYYDRATGEAVQITETLAGIGRSPGGCSPYHPGLSQDASVLVLAFKLISVEGCRLDGPQRNEADGLTFGFVRGVRKRPGNGGVVLDTVNDQRVIAGEKLTVNFAAHDPDGDPISFFAQEKDGIDVPAGSTITDNYDGTATFTWPTRPEDVGDHALRVAAFDEGGGEMFQDVTISIVPRLANACGGDCNGDGGVTVDEILTCIDFALGQSLLGSCTACDRDGDGTVTVDELLTAVTAALNGCPVAASPGS